MKNLKNITTIAVIMLLAVSSAYAQSAPRGNWREKMKSEKIAFITMELSLSPEEAQVFWPVYNQITEEKQATQKAMMKAYKEMVAALGSETVSDKEINTLLDKYLAAKQIHKESGKNDVDKYRKVLPAKKVAKLYVAEEKFRRQRIRSMKSSPQGQGEGRNPYANR